MSIELVKLERGIVKLELFIVSSGLDEVEIATAIQESNHVALVPKTVDPDFRSIFAYMVAHLFEDKFNLTVACTCLLCSSYDKVCSKMQS